MSGTDTRRVELKHPFKVDDKEVKELVIKKPQGGDLRGCNFAQLIMMDVAQIMMVLPRITVKPHITKQMIDDNVVDSVDLYRVGAAIADFFED